MKCYQVVKVKNSLGHICNEIYANYLDINQAYRILDSLTSLNRLHNSRYCVQEMSKQ